MDNLWGERTRTLPGYARESGRRLSAWLENRRRLAAQAEEFQKSFEKRSAWLVAANAISFFLDNVLHLSLYYPRFKIVVNSTEWTVWLVDLVAVGLLVLIYAVRRFYLQDETRFWVYGFNRQELKDLSAWLAGGASKAAELKPKVAFGSVELEPLISRLNFEAYKHSVFRSEMGTIVRRNTRIIQKNDRVFMLFYDMGFTARVIGYSALLPLDDDGSEEYLSGKISDDNLLLAKAACKFGERPSILVLFALVLSTELQLARGGATGAYSAYLNRSLQLHFERICPDLLEERKFPPVYVQTDKKYIRRIYEELGFRPTGRFSAEKNEFLRLDRVFSRSEFDSALIRPAGITDKLSQ